MTNDKEYPCIKRLDADCFRAQPTWAKQALAFRLLRCLAPDPITRRLQKALRLALLTPGIPMPPGMDVPPIIDTPPVIPPTTPDTGTTPPTYVAPWEPGPPRPLGGIGPAPGETEVGVYGSSADGYIKSQEATWDLARNNPTTPIRDASCAQQGLAMQGRLQIGNYWVARSFLYFDLSSIPSGRSIVSASVTVIGYFNALTEVSIQEGTQGNPLTTAHFNAYAGSAFSTLTWKKRIDPDMFPNIFELDAAGKAYVQGKFGGTAKFCLREYTKDYLDVAPTGPGAGNGMYFRNHADAANWPSITVVYK